MMLSWWSFQKQVVAADWIVMPRSCSCSMKSVVAAPSWTSPILWILPVSLRMRSVVVVLPASTWAKMPMFRYLLRSFAMTSVSV